MSDVATNQCERDSQSPLPEVEVEETTVEVRRGSRRIRPGEKLSLFMAEGVVMPLELAVIRRGHTAQVCDAALFDISDGGLAIATTARLPVGETILLCATCETEPHPLFGEELVVRSCRRKYDGGTAFFVSGFEFPESAFSRLYKAALDTLLLNRTGLDGDQLASALRQ